MTLAKNYVYQICISIDQITWSHKTARQEGNHFGKKYAVNYK